jgi:hypothetical protein
VILRERDGIEGELLYEISSSSYSLSRNEIEEKRKKSNTALFPGRPRGLPAAPLKKKNKLNT